MRSTENPDKWVDLILDIEGGEADVEGDRGGYTRYGLTTSFLAGINISIDQVDLETARDIYREHFWNHYNCDAMHPLPAFLLLDAIVHHGERQGSALLQRALQVKADGVIGEKTLKRSSMLSVFVESSAQLIEDYCEARTRFFFSIVERDKSQYKFLEGWINRLHRLQRGIHIAGVPGTKRGVMA